jgi:plasmid stabilization system protein ParE
MMPLSLDELETEALNLPARERADLAQRLFASLENEDAAEDPATVEQAWVEEAERRYQRYLAGEVEHALGRLAENPHVGPEIGGGVRKLGTQRFPYNLIYRGEPARVLVFAVAHQRRRPRYWRDRG